MKKIPLWAYLLGITATPTVLFYIGGLGVQSTAVWTLFAVVLFHALLNFYPDYTIQGATKGFARYFFSEKDGFPYLVSGWGITTFPAKVRPESCLFAQTGEYKVSLEGGTISTLDAKIEYAPGGATSVLLWLLRQKSQLPSSAIVLSEGKIDSVFLQYEFRKVWSQAEAEYDLGQMGASTALTQWQYFCNRIEAIGFETPKKCVPRSYENGLV